MYKTLLKYFIGAVLFMIIVPLAAVFLGNWLIELIAEWWLR